MNQQIRQLAAPAALSSALPGHAVLHRVAAAVSGFFTEPTHPFNLAVVRVVVFVGCLAAFNWDQLLWFSGLPSVLQFPPHSLLWLAPHIPINSQLALLGATVF